MNKHLSPSTAKSPASKTMPTNLSRWLCNKLTSPPSPAPDPLALLPVLSHRPTTPPPTTANGPFFQRLPAELRRQILALAFGNRVLHMELEYERPLITDDGVRKRDPRGEYAWRWRNGVCHRPAPGVVRGSKEDRLWLDKCMPLCGGVGAMGWMLACRQAYVEGAAVVYATNTLHMGSAPLILHLPQMVGARSLQMVTRVEVVWHLQMRHVKLTPAQGLRELMRVLPEALPGLVSLYLSVFGEGLEFEWYVVYGLDDMVREMMGKRLRECMVELPFTMYDTLRTKPLEPTVPVYWRPIGVVDGCERGYSVKVGFDDTPKMQRCFFTV